MQILGFRLCTEGGAGSQPGVSRHRNTVAGGRVGAQGGRIALWAVGFRAKSETRIFCVSCCSRLECEGGNATEAVGLIYAPVTDHPFPLPSCFTGAYGLGFATSTDRAAVKQSRAESSTQILPALHSSIRT